MGNFEDNLTFEDVINQTLENPDKNRNNCHRNNNRNK